jgi:xanthine dehydrogenase accessory factor
MIDRLSFGAAREWIADGREIAIATLIETEGSSPLEEGAMMFVDSEMNIEGSITGGCVESALVEKAQTVLAGEPPTVEVYGISDETAATVGLTCGGTVHVFVERLSADSKAVLDGVFEAAIKGSPAAVAVLIDGETAGARLAVAPDGVSGGFGGEPALLDVTARRETAGMLERGTTGIRRYGADGTTMGSALRVFVHSFARPASMVIIGATDFAAATAVLAEQLGYSVTIVDPREPFIRSNRFSKHANVAVRWPDSYLDSEELDQRDVVLIFSHDPKLDEPALISALGSGAGYIGALGSRRTQAKRVERLTELGVSEVDLTRIFAPCGLDLGARTPAETAISILAEVIAMQNQRKGEQLSKSDGPIHQGADVKNRS